MAKAKAKVKKKVTVKKYSSKTKNPNKKTDQKSVNSSTKKPGSSKAPISLAQVGTGPGIGHNQPPKENKPKKGGTSGAVVRKYVKAVESLEAEAREIGADKSELFKGAKSEGLDVKALKKLISQRRMDAIDFAELQDTIDIYEHAMSG